jgi:uncharacterized protein YegP (UPF0339 family)
MRFVIRKNRVGQFWYRISGEDRETMAQSKLFPTKESAESAIETIRREAASATVEDMSDERFDPLERQ